MRPVLYDHREELSGVPAVLADHGIGVEPRQLPVGDYVLSDRLVVERKTGQDLAASIKDRRLFEQVERMAEAYPAVVLVVEGDPVHISEASWMGGVARLLVSGVAVIRTLDAFETATWLLRMYRIEGKGPSEARGLPKRRRPTEDLERVAEDVLTCLPGISTQRARLLLEEFGSLAAVFAADERALRTVRGIGPVFGSRLAELFRAQRS
jgi:DNA excision repair protein ERCC-4